MIMDIDAPWADMVPEGDFISEAPTYRVGECFDLFHEERFVCGDDRYSDLKYYYYDPTEHGYTKGRKYPLLIFLHGTSNSLAGITCINYSGAERFASPRYQADMQGAYILVPAANEYRDDKGTYGSWCKEYAEALYRLIREFTEKYGEDIEKKFLLGNSSGAAMTMIMGKTYPCFFNALIPVGTAAILDDDTLDQLDGSNVYLFYAIGKKDEFHDFNSEALPRLEKLNSLKNCFVYIPEWVRNGDKGIASIKGGVEMDQHCLMNAVQANLMFDDGTPMDERLPRGMTGWIDEVNRNGSGRGREFAPHGGVLKTGYVKINDSVSLYYEEYGKGDRIILSAQCGFYHRGMQQRMAELGYHVYCITLRGFHPSSLIKDDYGDRWYDVFASDVLAFADRMGIKRFSYMGASHGAGVGWHLMLAGQERIEAFIAVVPGPHSLKEDTMSYRQMLEQGIIKTIPPFDPPIDNDAARQERRDYRSRWISGGPQAFEEEKKLDYGRPLMRMGSEEKLCEALRKITVPVLIIGGYDDPISTPELMMRTAGCLPHCKMVIYSNCGHNIDTDLIEETADEADRFIRNVLASGRHYIPV
ncbi:MAG: hypothetical protein CW338_09915 [Clostridiales bacterium]|nr:hypothetical protein [Clostridiales bacterium]